MKLTLLGENSEYFHSASGRGNAGLYVEAREASEVELRNELILKGAIERYN